MTTTFNPYHEWLGLAPENHNPGYPELLGLDPGEADESAVRMAFDRVIAQVRSHKPGPHAAEWARLIDELKSAKLAAEKMGFAAVVAASQPAAPSAESTADSAASGGAPPATPPAPTADPGSVGTGSVESGCVESPATSAAVDPIMEALGLDDFTTPDEELGEAPAEPPAATVPPAPIPTPAPATPAPATPTHSASAAPAPAQAAPAPVAAAPPAAAAPVAGEPPLPVAAAAAQRGGNYAGLIVGFVSCALMIGLLGGAYYLWFGSDGSESTDEELADNHPVPRQEDSGSSDTNENDAGAAGTASDQDQTQQDMVATEDDSASDQNENATSNGESPKSSDSDNNPDEPMPTTTPPPEPEDRELTDEQLKALSDQLKQAKQALGSQDVAAAREFLEKAKPMAGTKTHRAMIERLEALTGYVEAFHRAIPQALEKLQPGDSFPVGNAIVALVEKKPESVVIHVAGRNREYALNDLSLGLGIALADQALDQDAPISMVVKGAFQAVHPKATDEHIQEVRDWWRNAADMGERLGDLILVVDDDYDRMAGVE